MPDLAAYQQHYYLSLSIADRGRFWIMLGHGTREEFSRMESMLARVAHSGLNFRVLFKPVCNLPVREHYFTQRVKISDSRQEFAMRSR